MNKFNMNLSFADFLCSGFVSYLTQTKQRKCYLFLPTIFLISFLVVVLLMSVTQVYIIYVRKKKKSKQKIKNTVRFMTVLSHVGFDHTFHENAKSIVVKEYNKDRNKNYTFAAQFSDSVQ